MSTQKYNSLYRWMRLIAVGLAVIALLWTAVANCHYEPFDLEFPTPTVMFERYKEAECQRHAEGWEAIDRINEGNYTPQDSDRAYEYVDRERK